MPAKIPHRYWLLPLAVGSILITLPLLSFPSFAFEIRQAGKLQVAHSAQLFAFSTDPTIQEVLSQDFRAASRSESTGNTPTLTVSVSVTQQMLKPGVSLTQLAPGDPQVADLMRAAGANPPPLGDTGNQYDEVALARRMAAQNYMPQDTLSSRMINSLASPGGYSEGLGFGPPIPMPCAAQSVPSPGCPPVPQTTPAAATQSVGDVQQYVARKQQLQGLSGSADNNDYDTVVIARASASGAPEEMTIVAISHPGDDIEDVKKQIAERIANSILH